MPHDIPESEMETVLNTALTELKITGQHMAIPRWLIEPAPPSVTALARLELSSEPLPLIAWLKPQGSPHGD